MTFLSQPFPPSIYHYVNKRVSSETFTFEHIFAQLIPVLGALSLPWWCGLCRSEVVRASELILATVFVFRTKGKFQQPPLAWYLDDVLECILDKVFLFDRFMLRKFTYISPFPPYFALSSNGKSLSCTLFTSFLIGN